MSFRFEAPSSRLVADVYQPLHELGAVKSMAKSPSWANRCRASRLTRKWAHAAGWRAVWRLREMLIIGLGLYRFGDPRERFDAREVASRARMRALATKIGFSVVLALGTFLTKPCKTKPPTAS